jgi:hypothetical protein
VGHLTAVRHHLEHKVSRLVVGRDDCSGVFDVHVTSCTADDRVCGYLLDVHAPADLQVLFFFFVRALGLALKSG